MVLTRPYARSLVRKGQAREVGMTCDPGPWPLGAHYVILDRYPVPSRRRVHYRVDHYLATEADHKRLGMS